MHDLGIKLTHPALGHSGYMQSSSKFSKALAWFASQVEFATTQQSITKRARKTYCIFITPRSGSTWLANEIAKFEVIGHPNEFFNANEFRNSLRHNPSSDLVDYWANVKSKMMSKTGVIGFQISYFDLQELESDISLLSLMDGERSFIYLNRQNLAAQAVSLYIAYETKTFHAVANERHPNIAETLIVPYNGEKIKFWACHILQQEYGIESWIRANDVNVLRIQYESMIAEIDSVIRRIADWVGVDLGQRDPGLVPTNRIMSTRMNSEYCQKFLQENPLWYGKWSRLRGSEPCPWDGDWPFKD